MNQNYDNFEKITCTTKIKDAQNGYYAFDDTVFYGEKGGQLADQGTINGLPVTDLKWDGDTLYHQVAGELRDPIKMEVDWPTRLINTTVQSVFHLLDGYYAKTDTKITEVNANPDNQWYEVDSKDVTEEGLHDVEKWMNQVIQADVETSFTYVPGKEYPDPAYQKYEQVRLVHLGDINVQPCGTLHVNHTAQIQSLVILGTEKVAKGTKIYIATSLVTNQRLHTDETTLNEVAQKLSVKRENVVTKLSETLVKSKQLKKQLKKVKKELMQFKAQQLLAQDEDVTEITIDDASDLSVLAPLMMRQVKSAKLLLANYEKKTFLAIISPDNQARELLQKLQKQFTINGGGSSKIVTGNTTVSVEQVKQVYLKSRNVNLN